MNFKEWYEKISTEGIRLPYLHDPTSKQPSITLLFAYVTFLLALVTTICLSIRDITLGTTASMVFWVLAIVFYRMRHLDKVKFDLDDRSFELEGDDENEQTDETTVVKEDNEK